MIYKYVLSFNDSSKFDSFNVSLSNTWPKDSVMMFLQVLIFVELYCR